MSSSHPLLAASDSYGDTINREYEAAMLVANSTIVKAGPSLVGGGV
ncbi:MAG: hypothetical protein ACYTF0_06035 [Planctomycetota bacterium]|jgi:hypothetical protein